MKITRTSMVTGIEHTLDLPVTEQQLRAYDAGALLQDAFPDLPGPEREFIKTGTTPEEYRTHVLGDSEMETQMLDTENTEPMYIIGRLWAICEAAIIEAEMLVDPRAIAMMPTEPLAGFGLMNTKFMLALRKLRESGREEYYDDLIVSVAALLPGGFPRAGEVLAEGPLHLGYYHQRGAMR
jgi:hypothetical protein